MSVIEALSSQAQHVLTAYFEREIGQGRIFKAEDTIQIGWMLTILKADGLGALEVWEPDFDAFPIRWTSGATNTLRHLLIQRQTCEEANLDMEFPSICDAGVVSRRFMEQGGGFVMSRDHPEDRDSGWVFQLYEEEVPEDDGEYRSLFEICLHRPEIIPFVALPPGATVTVVNGIINLATDEGETSSRESDYLRSIAQSPPLI